MTTYNLHYAVKLTINIREEDVKASLKNHLNYLKCIMHLHNGMYDVLK